MGYDFATANASSLLTSGVVEHQLSRKKTLVFIDHRNVVWLPEVAYPSMESYLVSCRAANGDVSHLPSKAEVPCAKCTGHG